MVLLEKNGTTVYVPEAYYEGVYKPRGWRRANADKEPPDKYDTPKEQKNNDLVEELDRLNTLEQLKGFAEENGVDVEGITNRKQMRATIMNAMNM